MLARKSFWFSASAGRCTDAFHRRPALCNDQGSADLEGIEKEWHGHEYLLALQQELESREGRS